MLEEQRSEGGEYDEYGEYADPDATGAEDGEPGEEGAEAAPVAHTPLELAADARYNATGKRKTAIARVILKPGEGTYTINGRHLDEYFPRVRLQRMASQPLEAAGYQHAHGRGGSNPRGRRVRPGECAAPRHRACTRGGRPSTAHRDEAPRLPHSRPAREGTQEGWAQEGPQAAAVLEALVRLMRLFGTDGVRGVAGEFLTADLALKLGRAAALTSPVDHPQILIVRDTRESGEMLEAALAAGIAAGGGHALLAGVLPTPGASVLVRRYGFDMAAVVSASHNPYPDNGIKFFGPEGMKIGDDREAEIERRLEEPSARIGRLRELHGAGGDYLRELQLRFSSLDLSGVRVLLDCANGATHRVAPEIFRRMGAEVDAIAVEPDGRNINHEVGSTHIEALAQHMDGHDVGFAFDGDGDRVLAMDRNGTVVDGDELMALAALHLRGSGRLAGDGVAVTVMTNYGFHRAMADAGIEVATTDVGDRHVLAELVRRGWALGGEQSGHIIDTGFVPSGDGTAAALLALEALQGADLADRHAMEKLPQRLVNVRVRDRGALEGADTVWAAVERESEALEGRGRVLVRASGTEPLVRVMVEAPREDECQGIVDRLAKLVESELG